MCFNSVVFIPKDAMFSYTHTNILNNCAFHFKKSSIDPPLCRYIWRHISFLPFRTNSLERTINTCYLIFYHQSALVKVITIFLLNIMKHSDFVLETFQLIMTRLVFSSSVWFFLPMSPWYSLAKFFSYFSSWYWSWCSLRFFPQASSSSVPLSKKNLRHYHSYNFTFRLMTHMSISLPRSFLSTYYLLDTFM